MYELGHSPKSLIESLELVRLHSPPHILGKLLDICNNPEGSSDELAEIIRIDAALTSRVIMAVNSVSFGIAEPVDNIPRALTLLGHDSVKTMVLTLSIQQLFSGLIPSQKEFVCNAWLDSLYCAVFAEDIAQTLDYESPSDAYLAGLLHDFGQIVFDAKHHEQYVEVMEQKSEAEIINKEILKFGTSHTELGADIIESWPSLSLTIADAVRFHHEDEEQLRGADMLCRILAEASDLALHWARNGKVDADWRSSLVEHDQLKAIYLRVQEKVTKCATALGIPATGKNCLTQSRLAGYIEKEMIRLARKIRDTSLVKVLSCDSAQTITADTPRNLLAKLAQEMQLLFSIPDLALLIPDPESPDYLSFYQVNPVQPVSRFSIDNNNSEIIRGFLDKRSVWIELENKQDPVAPISDRQIIRRLNHEIALSLPLGHGDQVIGAIVIGVNRHQKTSLENLSTLIYGYLKNVAIQWLRNDQAQNRRTIEDDLQEELDQRDVDKLVHEISNPLSIIGNYIDIIKGNLKADGAESNREIEILKEELQRIGDIVLNFKDAKDLISPTVLLNDELKICVPLYVKSVSRSKEVEIKWNLDASDAEINISRDGLRQVVLNLVKNAVEARARDAEIMISSHHFVNIDGRAYAQFTVADRGRGVDSITRSLLFSASTSTKRGANRGLGLSVVAEILGNFDGHIKYLETEGGGATFEVLIPLLLNKHDN
ncbi:MAG TPA: HDOD domain-containing protein [Gammaproteobacteria bacterium]|nr:HDOD domain-containing protein [Gammaproteobacteria bacterium]